MRFHDRVDAGRQLGERLRPLAADRPVLLALPRGGVPVAVEVGRILGAPVEVFVVRKLGAPMQPELGLGAIAEDGTVFVDDELCAQLNVGSEDIREVAQREMEEVRRRVAAYRNNRGLPDVAGRTVILIDDGIATGGTARAAIAALRALSPARIIVAAPVAAPETVDILAREADEVVTLLQPARLNAIGLWYNDFRQLGDEDVERSLASLTLGPAPTVIAEEPAVAVDGEQEVAIAAGEVVLAGTLDIPHGATGIVLFAHGSGSSRKSPRNRYVASVLRQHGLATLLLDLLTTDEEELDERTAALRFDVPLLAGRLAAATDWLARNRATRPLRVGYFGASTGAAAALIAASARPEDVHAVVSRGGRPDLAGRSLHAVRAPTLFLVGGEDNAVIELNREAFAELTCEKRLVIIPGATHLFSEPGTLEQVAEQAAWWFERTLGVHTGAAHP